MLSEIGTKRTNRAHRAHVRFEGRSALGLGADVRPAYRGTADMNWRLSQLTRSNGPKQL